MNVEIVKLYLRLYYANNLLNLAGGPEKQGDLFDEEQANMEAILKRHHLPAQQQYLAHLFDFCDEELKMDECEAKLKEAGEQYLLSQPQLMSDALEAIRLETTDIYDVLVDMNIPTYVYLIFVCEQFRDGKTTQDVVLNEIRVILDKPSLHEMLMVAQKADEPEDMLMYKELQTSGLQLYNKFLGLYETDDEIPITNLKVLEVVGDATLRAAMLVQHNGFNDGEPISFELEVAQLLQLSDIRMVEYLLEKMMADLQDKNPPYAHVFKASDWDMDVTIVATCVLAEYPTQTENESLVPTYRLLKLIPNGEGEYCRCDRIPYLNRGDQPPLNDD